jgi:hypothetical protein
VPTDLEDRLDRLAGAPSAGASVLERLLVADPRRQRARVIGVIAALVLAAAGIGGGLVLRDRNQPTDVRIIDRPPVTEAPDGLEELGADRRLPPVGELGATWHLALTIPYGPERDQLGEDRFGPEHPVPAADGSWWVLDSNKGRAARFDTSGALLDEVALPVGGFQTPFVVGDRLVASRGAGEQLLITDGERADVVQVGGLHAWSSTDGQSLYDSSGNVLTVDDEGAVELTTGAPRTPAGNRFHVRTEGGYVLVDLPDVGKRLRISVITPPEDPLGVEVAPDADGNLHLFVWADVDGEQRAGYMAITPDGAITNLESVRDPFAGRDPHSPGRLEAIPGTNTVSLSYVDDDAVRIYTRDALLTTVPDLVGRRVDEALFVFESVGLRGAIDPALDDDSPNATVVAMEPGAGAVVPLDGVIGLRTAAPVPIAEAQCARTTTRPDASADGLPAAGQTDLDVVRGIVDGQRDTITSTYGALRVVLAHRDGRVYVPDGSGDPPIEQRADYQIIVDVPTGSCPDGPAFWAGVPLAFVRSDASAPTLDPDEGFLGH